METGRGSEGEQIEIKAPRKPRKLYVSQFSQMLYEDFSQRLLKFKGLYDHQKRGICLALSGKGQFVRADTNAGKTIIALAGLHWCLTQEKIGVYLVPHKRLLEQERELILQFFSHSTLEDEPYSKVEVVTLSGDLKPSKSHLQRHQKRLVIIATYEAFRSLTFAVQNREYFSKQRNLFGTVIIDEAHFLGDKTRGMPLQTLIYKLHKEHNPQFIFLSATFDEGDAGWLAEQFDCEQIYERSTQKFNCDLRDIEIKDPNNYKLVETLKTDEVALALTEHLEGYEGKESCHVLIFCNSRNHAQKLYKAIWEAKWWERHAPYRWCRFIHAGLSQEGQKEIFDEFQKGDGVKILISSPLLETGIDVPEIDRVLVVDPERYSATRLNQMCGRLRKDTGKVILIIAEEFQHLIEHKFELNATGTQIIQFNLQRVFDELPEFDLHRLILEQLFWHPQGERDLGQQLRNSISGYEKTETSSPIYPNYEIALIQLLNLRKVLKVMIDKEIVRAVGGKYALTLLGDAVVETGITVTEAIRFLDLIRMQIQKMPPHEILNLKYQAYFSYSTLFAKVYSKLLAEFVARRAVRDITQLERRKKRFNNIKNFIEEYHAKYPGNNVDIRKKYRIDVGDEEVFRRTAIWLASSAITLFESYRMHNAEQKDDASSYYDRQEIAYPPELQKNAKESLIFSQLMENKYRFNLLQSPRWPKRPNLRSRGVYRPEARFIQEIQEVLEKNGKGGALIGEISKQINGEMAGISKASVYETLNGPLESKIYRQLEREGKAHRPAHRYWLKKYKTKKSQFHQCQECSFFRRNKKNYQNKSVQSLEFLIQCIVPFLRKYDFSSKTHCKKGFNCQSKWQLACPKFEQRVRNEWFHIYYTKDFESAGNGKIRCPYCKSVGTLQTPTYSKMTMCRNCKILLKQVRKGRYHGRLDIDQGKLEGRIENSAGTPYIPISKDKRTVFLKEGEKLHVEDPRTISLPVIRVEGKKDALPFRKRNDTLFFDEVGLIILAGGTIETGLDALKLYGIDVISYQDWQVERTKEEEVEAQRLRKALRKLNLSVAMKIAIKSVKAKILSNISYTFDLGQFQPQKKLPLIYRQFDQIAKINLLLNEKYLDVLDFINRLRSREGIAENAAWEMIKASLPPHYQFLSRQIGRAVRSELHSGAKGLDPFNCALNYIYNLLARNVMESLRGVGFHKYYPGIGFLHRRYKEPSVIEHRAHRALIYDFIDPYRAPFRYYLLLVFQEMGSTLKIMLSRQETPLDEWCSNNTFMEKVDFEKTMDKFHLPIYTPSRNGELKLKQLFNLIWNHRFPHQEGYLSLHEIMQREARELKALILGEKTDYQVFSVLEDPKLVDYNNNLEWTLRPDAKSPIWDKSDEEAEDTKGWKEKPSKRTPKPLMNVIIVTHVDADGFLSVLHLLPKYFHWNDPKRGRVQILPTRAARLKSTLEEQVASLLWNERRAHNVIIIADLPIPMNRIFFHNLSEIYSKRLDGQLNHLDLIWYDHHPIKSSTNLQELGKEFGIKFVHDNSMHAYQIIRDEIENELQTHNRIDALLKNPLVQGILGIFSLSSYLTYITRYQKKSYFQQKLEDLKTNFREYLQDFKASLDFKNRMDEKAPWTFIQRLIMTESNKIELKDNQSFLDGWINCYEDYNSEKEKRPQRSWFNFFRDVLKEKEPPPRPQPSGKIPDKLDNILYYAGVHEIQNNKTFAAIVPSIPIHIDDLRAIIINELKTLPDFAIYLWPSDYSLSLRNFSRDTLNFSMFFADQEAMGHPTAFRVPIPRQKVMKIEQKPSLYLYKYQQFKDIIILLERSSIIGHKIILPKVDIPELHQATPPPTKIHSFFTRFEPINDEYLEIPYHDEVIPNKTNILKDPESIIVKFSPEHQIFLPKRDVTLIYSSKKETLVSFLHYLLCQFEKTSQSPKILFIDTIYNRLEFKQLINYSDLTQPFTILDNILFTYIPDLRLFTNFAKSTLKSLLKMEGLDIGIVVITSPLTLIKQYWNVHPEEPRMASGLFHTGGDLILHLRSIAKETETLIILTTEGILREQPNQTIHPWIQVSAQKNLGYIIYVSQLLSEFQLQFDSAKIDEYKKFIQNSSKAIQIPPLKPVEMNLLLKKISALPKLINFEKD